MDSSGLEDMFSLIGNVCSAEVHLGRGQVEMSTQEEAANGALHFHGQTVEGHRLMVAVKRARVAK
jgi:hypothetical protein